MGSRLDPESIKHLEKIDPLSLQNRGPSLQKSMLETSMYLASILEGLGRRFGRVFGRFFGPKMHAKSDLKKSARQAKSIGKTNTKLMSTLLQQTVLRSKIDEKSYVFWDIDFKGISVGFRDSFGRRKTSIFVLFSMFFR